VVFTTLQGALVRFIVGSKDLSAIVPVQDFD
jgi:hypothetical protein